MNAIFKIVDAEELVSFEGVGTRNFLSKTNFVIKIPLFKKCVIIFVYLQHFPNLQKLNLQIQCSQEAEPKRITSKILPFICFDDNFYCNVPKLSHLEKLSLTHLIIIATDHLLSRYQGAVLTSKPSNLVNFFLKKIKTKIHSIERQIYSFLINISYFLQMVLL